MANTTLDDISGTTETTQTAKYRRYNGSDWVTYYFNTTAGQVIQSTEKVFLHPTTNTINGKNLVL